MLAAVSTARLDSKRPPVRSVEGGFVAVEPVKLEPLLGLAGAEQFVRQSGSCGEEPGLADVGVRGCADR
jgi:hypothetical protein